MKLLATLLGTIIIFTITMAVLLGAVGWFFAKTAAGDTYSPLDFISDCNRFEVVVGVDRTQGRYVTYHYEYADQN